MKYERDSYLFILSRMLELEPNDLLFTNRSPSFQNQQDLTTYQYSCDFVPAHQQTPLTLVARDIMQEHFRKGVEPFFEFMARLPQDCKRARHKLKAEYGKVHSDVFKNIVAFFIKELLAFFSYLEVHSTVRQRCCEIYSGQVRLMVRWEQGPPQPKASTQETNGSSKRMVLFLSKEGSYTTSETLEQSVSASRKEQEGGIFQSFLEQQLLKSLREEVNLGVLKGKGGYFYLIFAGQVMGRGGFGQVNRGESVRLGKGGLEVETWAVKSCKKNINEYKVCGFSISQEREHEILLQLNRLVRAREEKRGRYIIELREVIDQNDRKYIVYEYCPHNSLKELAKRHSKPFTRKNLYEIALQLSEVLRLIHYDLIRTEDDFLHFSLHFPHDSEVQEDNTAFEQIREREKQPKGVVHRDIKLNNILVKEFSQQHIVIKLIDWAFSKRTFTDLSINKISCGTIQYQAPEIEDKIRYSAKVDVWAFGAVMFQLLVGRQMAEKSKAKNNDLREIKRDFARHINEMEFQELGFSEEEKCFWKGLLMGTLECDPKQRWSSVKVHDYVVAFQGYRPFNPLVDLPVLVRSSQARALLLYHLNLSGPVLTKRRLLSRAFQQYSRLLVEAAEWVGQQQLEGKVGLQQEQVRLAQKVYHFKAELIIKAPTAEDRIGEAAEFFQEHLPEGYEGRADFLSCIKYIADSVQHCGLAAKV